MHSDHFPWHRLVDDVAGSGLGDSLYCLRLKPISKRELEGKKNLNDKPQQPKSVESWERRIAFPCVCWPRTVFRVGHLHLRITLNTKPKDYNSHLYICCSFSPLISQFLFFLGYYFILIKTYDVSL